MKALLLGDLSPTEDTVHLFAEKKMDELFHDTISLFEGNDLNFVNLECTITDCKKEIDKFGPCLKCPAETADVIKQLGVHCCGLSNNHVFDYGAKGIQNTIEALEQVGVSYTGFGMNYEDSRKNFVMEKDGETLCIVAVCEHEYSYALETRMGSRPYDVYDTMADIRKARAEYDRVIVIYHGGKEYCQYPSPRLYKACRAMVDNGADVVLCQHSHCIGCYENYNGAHILYGQGNFHFVKSNAYMGWHSSLAVQYDTRSNEMTFIPLVSGTDSISLAKGGDKDKILLGFGERNEALANGGWQAGWHSFCEEQSEWYLGVIGRAHTAIATKSDNHMFAHFLDCEAHTDVWRELNPTANLTNEITG